MKTKLRCNECGKIIHSRYSGEFVTCACDDPIYIDETEHYVRTGGNPKKITRLNKQGEWEEYA
jgi:hypothetical protein